MENRIRFTTRSAAESLAVGRDIPSQFRTRLDQARSRGQTGRTMTAALVLLTGDLGAGKTVLAHGMAEVLGITDRILSPTFVLHRTYQANRHFRVFHHLDMYRIAGGVIPPLGLTDLLSDPDALVAIEWAEKIPGLSEYPHLDVRIEGSGDEPREFEFRWSGYD